MTAIRRRRLEDEHVRRALDDHTRIDNLERRPFPRLSTSRYSDAVLNDPAGGLVLYWKLDELGNTTTDALDSSGNGHTGTYAVGGGGGTGAATHPTLGVAALADGTAAEFDGVRDRMGIDSHVPGIQAFGEMSIECWVKTSQTASLEIPFHCLDETVASIVDSHNSTTIAFFFRLQLDFATGQIRFVIFDSGAVGASLNSTTVVNDGVRHHVVATYDGTTINIYIDGVLDATSTPGLSGISTSNGGLWVGGSHWQASNFYEFAHFEGIVDEVALYTVALPLTSVQTHYLIGGTASNPPSGPAGGPDITGDFPDGLELTDTGVTADTYGDSTHVAVVTVDAKGRITDAHEDAIGFPDSGEVAVTAAPSTDDTTSGVKIDLTAGESVAMGDPVYVKSDGKVWKADADTSTAFPAIGLATTTAAANATVTVLLLGIARHDAWAWTVGGIVYLSTSSGLTQTQPSSTDNAIQVIGVATNADRLYVNPQLVYLTHT